MRGLRGTLVAAAMAICLIAAPSAGAVVYKQVGSFDPGGIPVSVAVDPSSSLVYVAKPGLFAPTSIVKFDCSEIDTSFTCDAGSPASFGEGGTFRSFAGVALNPSGHLNAVYAESGERLLGSFDPATGAVDAGYPFAVSAGSNGQIAVDASGNIYVPNPVAEVIDVYDPDGGTPETPIQTYTCSACPGGAFDLSEGLPAIALDSSGNLYVADTENGRAMKIAPGDLTGAGATAFYSGVTSAVAVNQANGHVFVGGDGGGGFHVTELDSAGAEIADFGLGSFQNLIGLAQIAVDSATGNVYAGDTTEGLNGAVYVFSPVAPTATTAAATALTQTAATLNGTVNPKEGGAIASCEFEWGTTTAYSGGTVPCASNPPDGNSAVPVSGALAGLSPNTTYHYQLVASNGGAPVEGGDQSFTTLPNKPAATTAAATAVGQSAATLNGTVNAEGDDAACKFEYGTSTGYGSVASCSASPVTGTEAKAISAVLAGLSPATTYHYRVVATNDGGTTNGADMTFTTGAASLPPAPPSGGGSTPPPSGNPPPPPKKPLKCKKGFKKKKVKGKQKCVKVKKKGKKG